MNSLCGYLKVPKKSVIIHEEENHNSPHSRGTAPFSTLFVGSLGVVFGDIGTSPLYALKACFSIASLSVTATNVFGLISLCLWSLFLVVSMKYAILVMRIDNEGEGGILALTALCQKLKLFKNPFILLGVSLLGVALFFGDGIITPAISVLSALEGLEVITKEFSPYIIPMSLVVLSALFIIQRKGSGYIGGFFGPIMFIWFAFLAVTGGYQILNYPMIIAALNPYYALMFLINHPLATLMTMGGIVLVLTGGEALYADMGHFGKKAIRASWTTIVFPALILNYLGQGALLLQHPEMLSNPFFGLIPSWAMYPAVALSAVATVIASQSIISGIFTMTSQGILLNFLPRMKVMHTSAKQIGQIYISVINALLFILTVSAVLMFKTSDNLAQAYGLSVSGVMLITSILLCFVAHRHWKWPMWKVCMLLSPLLILDSIFVITNSMKLFEGAWYAVLITLILCVIMYAWFRGNRILSSHQHTSHASLTGYLKHIYTKEATVLPRTALFLCRHHDKVPSSLVMHHRHHPYLHEKSIFVTFVIRDIPYVSLKERLKITHPMPNAILVEVFYGFKETPNLTRVLHMLRQHHILNDDEELSIMLSKGVPINQQTRFFKAFLNKTYVFLVSISQNATDFYKMPMNNVIEMGVRYRL